MKKEEERDSHAERIERLEERTETLSQKLMEATSWVRVSDGLPNIIRPIVFTTRVNIFYAGFINEKGEFSPDNDHCAIIKDVNRWRYI